MNRNEKWLQWAIELQSLAQAGLTYGKDIYDRERYERCKASVTASQIYMGSGRKRCIRWR